ncbi:hypothetical protein [Stenotrophomonas geniculata]|uniref:hypothetical protein n=1 Tax=Stenotrophomonas geniculata TaxID=86188 RepID=UPI002E765234|nr:hypothetical protein [Stenotrophomonas geniculata]
MSKHTPGPWNVEDDTPFSLWVSCPDGKNPLHENRLNRDRLANARLIAAAPEMFEALDTIGGLSRALRQGGPDPMDLQGLSDALEEAVDLANSLVAQIEGRA